MKIWDFSMKIEKFAFWKVKKHEGIKKSHCINIVPEINRFTLFSALKNYHSWKSICTEVKKGKEINLIKQNNN